VKTLWSPFRKKIASKVQSTTAAEKEEKKAPFRPKSSSRSRRKPAPEPASSSYVRLRPCVTVLTAARFDAMGHRESHLLAPFERAVFCRTEISPGRLGRPFAGLSRRVCWFLAPMRRARTDALKPRAPNEAAVRLAHIEGAIADGISCAQPRGFALHRCDVRWIRAPSLSCRLLLEVEQSRRPRQASVNRRAARHAGDCGSIGLSFG